MNEEEIEKIKVENDILKTNYGILRGDIQKVVNKLGFPEDTIISDEFIPMIIENYIPKQKIKDKIEEYLEYDKKYKTYTKDGKENFTMEYFKAKALQELLESEGK